MDKTIPISDNQKVFIANGIFRAINQDLPEIIYENNLPTTVGSGLFRWNFVNRNLSDALCGDFETCIQSRGSWKLLLLRDKNTNLSFSIMSEKNFQKLQRSSSENIHYLEALICANKTRKPLVKQISLFKVQKQKSYSVLETLRNQLLSNFSEIVDEHVLILFDYNYMGIISVRAVLLTPKMEIALSDDWSIHLKSTYISEKSLLKLVSDDDNDVFAKLKPQFDDANKSIVEPLKEDDSKYDN